MRMHAEPVELVGVRRAVWDAIGDKGADYMVLQELVHSYRPKSRETLEAILDKLGPYIDRIKPTRATTLVRKRRLLASKRRLLSRLLRSGEVASRLGVTQRTVQAWHKAGKLPGMRLPGGHLRFAEENVQAVETWAEDDVLRGRDDPVLSELWDNKADAAYDKLR